METPVDRRTFISLSKEKREMPVLDKEPDLRTILRERLGCLIFRRVGKVHVDQKNYINTVFVRPSVDGSSLETSTYNVGEMPPPFTKDQAARAVFENYSQFSIVTSVDSLRKEPEKYVGKPIKAHSNNYADFDLVNFSFVPCERTMKPREEDLVCGVIDPERKNGLRFSLWFICSEQFFRFWTLIMFDYHSSYDKIIEKQNTKKNRRFTETDNQALKRKVMAGNHLMTNGFRKWMLSCSQDKTGERRVESNEDEIQKRFWVHRVEYAANWVHFYPALVLIARYKEMPCDHNVPNNLNAGPFMDIWDLPQGWDVTPGDSSVPTSSWLQMMCETYSLFPTFEPRDVDVKTFDTSAPPRGTRFVAEVVQGMTKMEDLEGQEDFPENDECEGLEDENSLENENSLFIPEQIDDNFDEE